MKLQVFQEQIFFATVRITVGNATGQGVSIGTGFLYRVPITEKESCIFLVSNKHVYGDPNNPLQVSLHKATVDNKPSLGEVVAFSQAEFKTGYTEHPNSAIDLACLNVSTIGGHTPKLYYKTLDDSLLADFAHEELLPGNDVWFVGYPENRFDVRNNLPILRRGYIASIPSIDFDGREELVIDAQVFRGSSGSPVFCAMGGHYKLIGVVAQTMIRNQKLQTVPAGTSLGVEQTIGLGIVLKATLLNALFTKATETIRARRAQNRPEPTSSTKISEKADASNADTTH